MLFKNSYLRLNLLSYKYIILICSLIIFISQIVLLKYDFNLQNSLPYSYFDIGYALTSDPSTHGILLMIFGFVVSFICISSIKDKINIQLCLRYKKRGYMWLFHCIYALVISLIISTIFTISSLILSLFFTENIVCNWDSKINLMKPFATMININIKNIKEPTIIELILLIFLTSFITFFIISLINIFFFYIFNNVIYGVLFSFIFLLLDYNTINIFFYYNSFGLDFWINRNYIKFLVPILYCIFIIISGFILSKRKAL